MLAFGASRFEVRHGSTDTTEPVAGSAAEPVAGSAAEPVAGSEAELAAKPVAGSAAELAADPVAGSATELAAKPVAGSAAEPAAKPVAGSAAKLTGTSFFDVQSAPPDPAKPVIVLRPATILSSSRFILELAALLL